MDVMGAFIALSPHPPRYGNRNDNMQVRGTPASGSTRISHYFGIVHETGEHS
jgi:hypothetical protein